MLNGSSGWFGPLIHVDDERYDNNLNCTWILHIPADGYLRLNFGEFETEQW